MGNSPQDLNKFCLTLLETGRWRAGNRLDGLWISSRRDEFYWKISKIAKNYYKDSMSFWSSKERQKTKGIRFTGTKDLCIYEFFAMYLKILSDDPDMRNKFAYWKTNF